MLLILSHMTCYVGKCDNPLKLIQADIITVGYEDPALEGENITFTYPTGAILSGPNSSACMGNGEWEPDPREVECAHECELVTTGTTMPSVLQVHCIPCINSFLISKKTGAYPLGIQCLPIKIILIKKFMTVDHYCLNTLMTRPTIDRMTKCQCGH